MSVEITIEKTQNSRIDQFDPENIGFGKVPLDSLELMKELTGLYPELAWLTGDVQFWREINE